MRYDPAVAGDVGKLVAPPYDVIDPHLREVLLHESEYNIAHITKATRASPENPYAESARRWEEWRRSGVVRPDPVPAFYVYEQHFHVRERKFSRTALTALVELRPLGDGILPHEKTLSGPRTDRLELMRATRTQFGQVFALYEDPERAVDALLDEAKKSPPLVHATTRDNILHRLWAITDPDRISRLQDLMARRELLIADGHHRYETALAYLAEHPDWPAARYRMMALVNTANAGLVVLPTHRLVKDLPGFDREGFVSRLRANFDIRPYPGDSRAVRSAVLDSMRAAQEDGRHAFGLYLGNGRYHLLILRDEASMNGVPGHSEAWRRLDVAILHHLVIERAMGITPEAVERQDYLEYVQDFPHAVRDAAERVREGRAQALLLLNPTRVDEVLALARRRELMPQKSTYFYPKVHTGIVMNCLDIGLEASRF